MEKNIIPNDIAEDTTNDSVSKQGIENKKPILPDDQYTAEVAKEDPKELEEARKRLMTLLRVKCKSIGGETLTQQIEPMIYSMSTADCNQMYKVLKEKGVFGMMSMVIRHNNELKKKKN